MNTQKQDEQKRIRALCRREKVEDMARGIKAEIREYTNHRADMENGNHTKEGWAADATVEVLIEALAKIESIKL